MKGKKMKVTIELSEKGWIEAGMDEIDLIDRILAKLLPAPTQETEQEASSHTSEK